jgi:fibronectin type 3 domain-containing protein
MPRNSEFQVPRGRFALSGLSLLVIALFLVMPGVGSAFTLNASQLDYGYCGQNLQLGSDQTASSTATPSFVLTGDGSAASYQMFIDGAPIGTFNSDTSGNVCIRTTTPLADGAHVLTGNELRPNSGNAVPAFNFSVDTVPPPAPSGPTLAFTSDTGVKGDNITSFHNFTITGTSATGAGISGVSAYWSSGSRFFGGAAPSGTGTWSIVGSVPSDGTYVFQAQATDEAANVSPLSTGVTVTVDSTPPTSSLTSPASGATVSGTVSVAASAADTGSGVASVAFQVDGVTQATDTTGPYTFAWNSAGVANGQHTLKEIATDVAGNTSNSSVTVSVQNGTTTAPGAPSLNNATAGNGSVALAWSAPSSNGGSAITGYKIYRGTSSGTETLLTTLGNVTSWTDNGAANGTTYYYKVTAVNSVGESAASNEMSATPTQPATVPGAPTLNSAAGGNANVALAWTAPSSNGGSAITGYKVYRGTSSGNETLLTTLGNVTSWTDNTASNGATYFYKVTVLNSVGESAASNELSATPSQPATVPGAPTLSSAAAGNGSVALAWSAPSSNGGSAIIGYKIYRGTSSGGETLLTTLGNVTSWTDNTASNGATYFYKVTALNSIGESAASNELSATPSAPATAPSAPSLNSATPGNGSVALAWSAPSSNGGSAITGYRVYRGTSSGSETLLTTLGNVTSWTDSGVTNGTTYFYKVTALNSVGESGASNELSATPTQPATVPGAPSLTSATAGNGSVALGWSAPSSNGGSAITGYKIYRGTSSGNETLLTTIGNVTSWTDNGVTNGTTYFYKVTALNSVGESAASNEMSATPSAVAPGAPSLNSATAGNGTVALAWSAPSSNGGSAITGYRVYRGTSSGSETLLTTLSNLTSWTDTGVTNGSTYYYKVSALNSAGESVASNERSATPTAPATVPGAPSLTGASAGKPRGVALTWKAPTSNGGSAITAYKVYRSTSSGSETLLTTIGNVTSWVDANAAAGTTYYYQITAVNAVGESSRSNELSASPGRKSGHAIPLPVLNARVS